jgi:cellulose synthase operon protein YhjQ
MTDQKPQPEQNETPEDVATLYSWANLHGAKYRDFSASRAQAREEARLRVEEALAAERRRQEEEAERIAQEEAQEALRLAAEAAEAARQAEAERLAEIARQAEAERQAVLSAQEAQRQAAQQRAWQSPPAEVYAGNSYAPPAVQTAQPNPPPSVPAPIASPEKVPAPQANPVPPQPRVQNPQPQAQTVIAQPFQSPAIFEPANSYQEFSGYPASQEQFAPPSWLPPTPQPPEQREQPSRPAWLAPDLSPYPAQPQTHYQPQPAAPAYPSAHPHFAHSSDFGTSPIQSPYAQQGSGSNPSQPASPSGPVDDTLLGSRDRLTNRWFALKNVFDPNAAPAEPPPQQAAARVPVIAVFSLAGGVGKTSLVASLGRALSSRSERILLVDTAVYGLLPFFFGARDQRPNALRTFNPPGVSADAPIQLITLDPEGQPPDQLAAERTAEQNPDWMLQEIGRYSRGAGRVLIDLPTASGSTTRRILRLNPTVLVPVAPDMNSVVSVGAIEAFFRHNGAGINPGGKPVMPYYILNQFDYSLPLHLDVREILREQIGDRLLPFALRRSSAVSEALAEGMTVMDYAPNNPVAEDYGTLAGWVRSLSAPAAVGYRGVRWSER